MKKMSTFVILLIILIIFGVTFYLYYIKKNSKTTSKKNPKEEAVEEIYQSESYSPYPCYTNIDCDDKSFCYYGNCVIKPREWDDKISSESNNGLVCTHRHMFNLKSGKLVMRPGMWRLNECMDICALKDDYYILTDNDVCQYSPDEKIKKVTTSEIIYKVLVTKHFDNHFIPRKTYDEKHRIIQLFVFGMFLYCLTDLGKVFILENNVWMKMDFFRGRDIISSVFLRVTTCIFDNDEFGLISFTDNDRTITYFDMKWDEIKIRELKEIKNNSHMEIRRYIKSRNEKHYSFSKNRITILIIDNYKVTIYYYPIQRENDVMLKSVNNVYDACIDPNNPSIFYCLFEDCIKKYTLRKSDGFLLSTDSINLEDNYFNDFNVKEEVLNLNGVSLITTFKEIWLISNNECHRT
jgi:hypothetical protein